MRFLFTALLLVVAFTAVSCGDDPPPTNQPPVVGFVERPQEGEAVGDRARFSWQGVDPDGEIAEYQISVDGAAFTSTSDTTTVLMFTRDQGTDSNPQTHRFAVRAVDNKGLTGNALTASFLVSVFNEAPVVTFVSTPPSTGYIGPVAELVWTATDDDGTVDFFEWVLDDTDGDWNTTTDSTLTIDFSTGEPVVGKPGSPLNTPIQYLFHLRAVDNDLKRSEDLRTTFLAGPENLPPVIELVGAPPLPPGTVGKQATWSWTADDPDGSILRFQYALDLMTDDDWRRWDATTLTLDFTRADGRAEDPEQYTFFLRAQDDDSTYSGVIMQDFLVGVPNEPPSVTITNSPNPDQAVGFRFTFVWTFTDDEPGVTFEYAVDDTVGASAWAPTDMPTVTLFYSATDVALNTCSAGGCNATGDHVFYVRAIDAAGVHSPTASAGIKVFTRTPTSAITEPTGPGGEVAGSTSLALQWTSNDQDGPTFPVTHEVLVREVNDFADFPDAGAAVTEDGLTWVDVGMAMETTLDLESGKLYLVATRATDVADAPESFFTYGTNVLKVTVP